jgi:hypothetical protein
VSTYRTILARLETGATPERIAADLDRREDAVRAILESMRREGHVRRIDCGETGCSACPMADSCAMPTSQTAQYVVSAAGRELLAAERPSEHSADA